MIGFYIDQSGPRHWLVKYSRFGCNSEIVATFEHRSSALAYAAKRNRSYFETTTTNGDKP